MKLSKYIVCSLIGFAFTINNSFAQAALAKNLQGSWSGTLTYSPEDSQLGEVCAAPDVAILFKANVEKRALKPKVKNGLGLKLTDQSKRKFTSTNVGEENKINNFGHQQLNTPSEGDYINRFYGFTSIKKKGKKFTANVTAVVTTYISAGEGETCYFKYVGSVAKK